MVNGPPGVDHTVAGPVDETHFSFEACLAEIKLPDAPVSSKHLSVSGFSFSLVVSLTYISGRTSVFFAFLLG